MTLASNVGHEAEENTIGTISKAEAREALRKHKGNIWASVTECVEGRQQKVGQIIPRNYRSVLDDICLYTFHSAILASLYFNKNKILSPGLENNHTLKCFLAIFQHNHICQDCSKNTRSTFEGSVIFQSRGQGPDSC